MGLRMGRYAWLGEMYSMRGEQADLNEFARTNGRARERVMFEPGSVIIIVEADSTDGRMRTTTPGPGEDHAVVTDLPIGALVSYQEAEAGQEQRDMRALAADCSVPELAPDTP